MKCRVLLDIDIEISPRLRLRMMNLFNIKMSTCFCYNAIRNKNRFLLYSVIIIIGFIKYVCSKKKKQSFDFQMISVIKVIDIA